ncbi:TolB family protein [Pareuzebyella sediminis]|uniref:TolB family protein n=1 Tax=Pareuzebyella sediminis TaxID=2607998 RepID=UPI0011EFAECB|nr:PD40 domain-containing protein [Pareuzebyella sediminis]
MKSSLTYNVVLTCIIMCMTFVISAQEPSSAQADSETNKRVANYLKLKELGYDDREIFQDLGNVNFLQKNYETALFWYDKLKEISRHGVLGGNYDERYLYALQKTGATTASTFSYNTDWMDQIKADYEVKKKPEESILNKPLAERYRKLDFQRKDGNYIVNDEAIAEADYEDLTGNKFDGDKPYKTPLAVSPDGKTAYFSKAVSEKPLYGIFSKKETLHKIYKADKVDGQWRNIKEVAITKKHYSAKHPAISADGKRLFFASNMPGTFGEFDIYVAEIQRDGSIGVAKNLGTKVNSKKNDMYPNVVGTNTLFFASEGRGGEGGLDVFMTQVGKKSVDLAVNLGSQINSNEDDFAVTFTAEKGKGYVMSNRGNQNTGVQRVAFTYADSNEKMTADKSEYDFLEAFNPNSKTQYSSTVFEDE